MSGEMAVSGVADGVDWRPLDERYAAYLDEHPSPAGGSLLAQTILTGPARRSLLPLVDVPAGSDYLDVGTGFGPMLFEAAHLAPIRGVGLDRDADVLKIARMINESLASWLHPGAALGFEFGDVGALPFEAAAFDVCSARLVFQHLPDPTAAVAELVRVLRPGGRLHVFDVDDGMSITYPAPSSALAALEAAFAVCQSGRGGDREVGRKLTTYFSDAGLEITRIHLLPGAEHQRSTPGDASRTVNSARLMSARPEIIARGLMTGEEFDARIEEYRDEPSIGRFRAETQVLVVATKPA
jgi:SAM-dependent methyltransferase